MPETIFLKPLSAWELAQKKREKLPGFLRVLTSLKTTAILGATLGTLLAPAAAGRLALGALKGTGRFIAKKPLLSLVGIPTATGILVASKRAREITKTALDPRESIKKGKVLGEIIEEPKKAKAILGITEEMTTKEKIITGAKKAGKLGAIIAGAGALAVGVKAIAPKIQDVLAKRKATKELKIIEEREATQRLAGLKQVGFTEPRPVGLGGMPISPPISEGIRPTGAPGGQISPRPIQNIIQISVR